MTRFLLLGLVNLVVGCAVTPQSTPGPASPAPFPSPTSRPVPSPAFSQAPARAAISGTWAYGFAPEPEPSSGTSLNCPPTLNLNEDGGALVLSNRALCGLPSDEARGARNGDRLHLEGSSYRGNVRSPLVVELMQRPASDHLTGTWNGRAVWLVPHGPCPSVASLCSVDLEGALYDAAGEPFTEPSQVRVVSTNPSNPYESTVDGVGGRYRFQSVPIGIELLVTATATGHQSITRHVTPLRGPAWTSNFGGPATEADPAAPEYALIPAPSAAPSP